MSFSFGNPGGNTSGGEKKTGTLFGSTTAPPGGLFGASQQQNNTPQTSLFGQSQQQNNAPQTGLFGSTAAPAQQNSLFGALSQTQQPASNQSLFGQQQQQQQQQGQQQQQQSQQQQQQSNFSNSLFGSTLRPAPSLSSVQAQSIQQQRNGLPQLGQSSQAFAASLNGQREKSVIEQIRTLNAKWDPTSPECVFTYYFYINVSPDQAPFYGPGPGEDEKRWEEALANKPYDGAMPVLARGFEEVAMRITQQSAAVDALRHRLHEINNALITLKDKHELTVASRITEAKRKHVVFTQRTLALATKVQILRNRGYVMDQQEEELKKKLIQLERQTFDPVLGGRQEEIWARMSGVRERARILQEETEKLGKVMESQQNGELLSEEDQQALNKLLQDYDRQLEHLKKWVDDTKEEYEEWETAKQARPTTKR